MELTPWTEAGQPRYPAPPPRRRSTGRLTHWCGRTIATGAALLTLSLSACSTAEEVRLAGGSVMPQLDDIELSYPPPPIDGKPPQQSPSIVRDPRKPPPGGRHLPPPRRTRT